MSLRPAGRAWSRELHGLVATGQAGVQGDFALAVVPQERLSRAAGPSSTLRTASARSVRLSRAPPRCGRFYRGGEGLAGCEVVARGCGLLPSSSPNWEESRALGSDCRGCVAVGGGLLWATSRAEAEAFFRGCWPFAGRAVSITLALGEHQRLRSPEVVLKSLRTRLSYPGRVDEAAACQPLETSSRALMATGDLLASQLTTVCSRRGARFRSPRAAETWYVGRTTTWASMCD
jgi:hypothetical protein